MGRQSPNTRTSSRSIAEKAYEQLHLEIVECRLAPGQTLTEASVASRLHVGKTPAREALRRLVLEGLVRVTPRHGYTVSPISLRDVRELFELRMLVEPKVIEIATGNFNASHYARLIRLSDVGYISGGRDSVRKFLRANTELHCQIAMLSGNRRMAEIVSGLLSESERLINFGVLAHPQSDATVSQHKKLLEAMVAGDIALARGISEEHIASTRQMVVQALLANRSLEETPITIGGPNAAYRK